ncbi:MAG: DUF1353 domain-containing protein [Candidatus Methylomirabilis oxygeniifera]|uniref:DUF1353 domain-containing protein n=1 Tax=Methylomirabilis oxygeniifera TaxID=671143 RepID=D5MJ89_METO1|nr:MAG: DUF1353 domain-containing protein [Candidatus Methylomirabilis oxyfera]CBE67454.1 conserved exported protein of unknown function [Candidatus Methylomirabilis oxyfera]
MRRFLRLSLVAAAFALISPVATAQEYFGEFLDRPKGAFIVEAQPRPLFRVETDFRFKDPNGLLWSTPAGTEVDGASIPQLFWSIIGGPFEGPYINASIIHDYYCRTMERTAHDTHRNLYYGMRTSQVPKWKAKLMHWAVSAFGPSWKLERRVVMRQTCANPPDLPATCSSVPTSEVVPVKSPPIDLSDPVVLAAAISKMTAVARTLLTSNGEVLDVTAGGPVSATVEGIQASADAYRQVFTSKEFSSSPARLGLLSQATGSTLADVQPWAGNRIPSLKEAIVLTPKTVSKVEASAPFKLDPRSKDLIRDRVDLELLKATIHIQDRSM